MEQGLAVGKPGLVTPAAARMRRFDLGLLSSDEEDSGFGFLELKLHHHHVSQSIHARWMITPMWPLRASGQSIHARTMLTPMLPKKANWRPEHVKFFRKMSPGTRPNLVVE